MSIAIQIEYAAQIWTTFMYFNVTNIESNKMANKHFFVTETNCLLNRVFRYMQRLVEGS